MKKFQIPLLLLSLVLFVLALSGCGPEEPLRWTPVGSASQTEAGMRTTEPMEPPAPLDTDETILREVASQPMPAEDPTETAWIETTATDRETYPFTDSPTETETDVSECPEELPERSVMTTGEETTEGESQVNYVANTNTKKFHVPDCSSVADMKESNKLYYTGTREELIDQGYQPCKRCNP